MPQDELDQLIESSFSEEEAPDDEQEFEPTPDESNAIESEAVVDDEGDVEQESEPDLEDTQEEELPDEDPEGTDPQPDPEPEVNPEIEELRKQLDAQSRSNQQQQAFIRSVIENAQQEQALKDKEAEEAKAAAEYQRLLDKWEDMDPDDARREQVKYVMDREAETQKALQSENETLRQEIHQSKQMQAQAAYEASEATAKADTIEYLSQEFKLNDFDRKTLNLMSSPEQMEQYAEGVKAQRRSQTSAARQAKRQTLSENPALRGGNGGQGAPVPHKEAKSLDEFVDNLW